MAKSLPNKEKLTHVLIRKAQHKGRAYLIWDTYQRGLVLRVEATGHKAFKCIYKVGGRARWYHLGAADAIGLADARKLAARVMFRVAEGADPQAQRKAARSSGTFEDVAKQYAVYAARKNKSWKQADALVKRHLLPRWGKLKAAAIARGDVKSMMRAITAPIVANQTLAAASAIFTWAVKEEVANIAVNPCVGIERNPVRARERVLSASELPLFWRAFGEAGLPGMALKMVLLTGQRPGEVTHMRTEHIADGWWTLPGQPVPALRWPGTKNGESHRVWLPEPAQAIVRELDAEGFVFGGERGGVISRLQGTMAAVCNELGVERAVPHDLRRSHGTMITTLGFGRDAMNRVQNHKEGGIASVYDRHQYADENRLIMETVAARIMELAEGTATSNVIAGRFR